MTPTRDATIYTNVLMLAMQRNVMASLVWIPWATFYCWLAEWRQLCYTVASEEVFPKSSEGVVLS